MQEIRFYNDLFPQVFFNTILRNTEKQTKLAEPRGTDLFINTSNYWGKSLTDPDISPQIHMQK